MRPQESEPIQIRLPRLIERAKEALPHRLSRRQDSKDPREESFKRRIHLLPNGQVYIVSPDIEPKIKL